MKRLYPDPPKPHHVMFPRELLRDLKPRSEPMRHIDFHEQPHRVDRAVGITSGLILLGYLVWCAWAYFKPIAG